MPNKNKRKIFYYTDELKDDFAGNNINTRTISSKYIYDTKNCFLTFIYFLIRTILKPIVWIVAWLIYHPKIKNKRVLKELRGKGYYMYSNHVLSLDPLIPPIMFNYCKYCGIVSGADTFSIHPIVTFLVKCLGAFPIPNLGDGEMYKRFTDHMSKLAKNKKRILIYPEAHIWPFYNKIRPFVVSPFKYPVNDNVPVISLTTTFKQRGNKKPYPIIYLDGPYYPDSSIENLNERAKKLRNDVYNKMCERVEETNSYSFHSYIKK